MASKPTTPEPSVLPPAAPTTPPSPEARVPEPEPKKHHAHLSRDDRIRVLTLRDAGLTYMQICNQLGISFRQVQYTCQSQQATPKKARGNTPKLSKEDVDRIVEFLDSSERTRFLPLHKVIKELELPVGTTALARALNHRGWSRDKEPRQPSSSRRAKGGLKLSFDKVTFDDDGNAS